MVDVEVFGAELAPGAPRAEEVRRLCAATAASLGVNAGHVAVEFVEPQRIAELNARFRAISGPTDVLSFPIDGAEPLDGSGGEGAAMSGAGDPHAEPVPRELGDVIICPEHTVDLREAIVHGMLHLLGMDHESDHGEMLALQDELLARSEL